MLLLDAEPSRKERGHRGVRPRHLSRRTLWVRRGRFLKRPGTASISFRVLSLGTGGWFRIRGGTDRDDVAHSPRASAKISASVTVGKTVNQSVALSETPGAKHKPKRK
jgi:hypothetical protein